MIILSATDQKIQIVLGQTVTTNQLDWSASYVDVASATYTPLSSVGATNNTTDVDVVASPASSHQIQLKFLTVYNNDTSSQVVTLKKVSGANTRCLCKVILQSNHTLQYADGEGFTVLAPDGILITSATSLGISAGTQSESGANTVVLANSNGVSFGLNTNNVLTASVSSATGYYFETPHAGPGGFNSFATAVSSVNVLLQRVYIPYYLTATRADVVISLSATNCAGSLSFSIGAYEVRSDYLYRATEGTRVIAWDSGGDTNATNSYSGISGIRWRSVGATFNFTPGDYYLAFGAQGSSTQTAFNASLLGIGTHSVQGYPYDANINGNSVGDDVNNLPVLGVYFAGTNDLPLIIGGDAVVYAGNANYANYPNRNPYIRFFGSYA